MTYGFKFYNTSGEIVLDDDYIKPWFAGKGVPLSVTDLLLATIVIDIILLRIKHQV